jgi:hypothetical protein
MAVIYQHRRHGGRHARTIAALFVAIPDEMSRRRNAFASAVGIANEKRSAAAANAAAATASERGSGDAATAK